MRMTMIGTGHADLTHVHAAARLKAGLAQPVVVDLRNIYRPDEMAALGFAYRSIGR